MNSIYLDNNISFSPGAFSSRNNGEVGSGWGIATPTTFVAAKDKTYDLFSYGGLCIDLYSLFEMYPKIKLNFKVGEIEIINNKEYFIIEQKNNILTITPNTIVIKVDNYLSTEFILPIYYYKENDSVENSEIVNLKINFINSEEINYGPNELKFEYDNLDIKISLASLIKEYQTGGNNGTFEIVSINSYQLKDLNLVQEDLLDSENIVLNKINILNPKIKISYKEPINSINYLFNIEFEYRSPLPPKTIVTDIFATITPKDAVFIDIKDYVIGDSYNLNLEEVTNLEWLPSDGSKYMKLNISGNYIGIIPYTKTILENIPSSVQYFKRFKYTTGESSGMFTLYLTIEMKNIPKNIEDYKLLTPNILSKLLKISNKDFGNYKKLDCRALIKNYYFPSLEEFGTFGEIRGEIIYPLNSNFQISNVDGINLFITDKIDISETLKIKFDFPYSNSLIGTLKFEEDNPKYEEYFKVSPILIDISKNFINIINIYDYIFTNEENYKFLEFEHDEQIQITLGNIHVDKNLFYGNIINDTDINGKIKVKSLNTYVDDLNTDDFGNIIGYREIPYTIIKSTKNDKIDTSVNLEIYDLKFFINSIDNENSTISIFNDDGVAMGGLDISKLINGEIEILNVEINELTNIPTELIKYTYLDEITITDKMVIGLNENNIWTLIFNNLYFLNNPLPIDGKVVLNIEYRNSDNEINSYLQNLYFYKL